MVFVLAMLVNSQGPTSSTSVMANITEVTRSLNMSRLNVFENVGFHLRHFSTKSAPPVTLRCFAHVWLDQRIQIWTFQNKNS